MTDRLEGDAIARMIDDLSRADLRDPRRVARVQQITELLAVMPGASLPKAMGTDAALEGAYRLFNNDAVSFEQLFDAHAVGTAERARDSDLVLAIHDTTRARSGTPIRKRSATSTRARLGSHCTSACWSIRASGGGRSGSPMPRSCRGASHRAVEELSTRNPAP